MSRIWKIISHTCRFHVTHMNVSCGTYERVMSHIWSIHVTHTEESCHTYGGVAAHTWMSQVTLSRHPLRGGVREGVMSHMWKSHVTRMKTSCHTYEGGTSHIWRSHGMHVKESCHTEQAPPTWWDLWRSHITHMKVGTGRHPTWSGLSCLATPGSAASWHTHCHMLFVRMYSFAGTCFKKNCTFLVLYFQTKTDQYDWVDLKWYMMHGMIMMSPHRDMLSVQYYFSRDEGGWVGRRFRAQRTYTLANTVIHLHVAALRC